MVSSEKTVEKNNEKYKPIFIADILQNPISLTWLEKKVLGTTVFNRLHGVKQNSTAYLTFPALNHVRFSHSLGAAAIVSKLFSFGVQNATGQDRDNFLKDLTVYLKKMNVPAGNFGCLTDKPQVDFDSVTESYVRHNGLPWITAHGENVINIKGENDGAAFLISMQAVRIAALVHDLGHPPFSHVTEHALNEVYLKLDEKKKLSSVNTVEEEFISAIGNRPSNLPKDLPPHEFLTLNLFDSLQKQILGEINDQNRDSDILTSAWFSLTLAKLILSNGNNTSTADEKNLLKSLHDLVASDLDADRLDYIQRDSLLSGIRNDNLGLQRLIYLYQLKYVAPAHTQEKMSTSNVPMFLPSVRALRNLEEFFQARYTLYRNVIFHHHVVKTDAFLQDAVEELIIEYLSKQQSHTKPNKRKPEEISWLWEIFRDQSFSGQSFLNKVYLGWDDHWLITLLRHRYIELSGGDQNSPSYKKLEELIASKRNYFSLVKRIEDFAEIERSIVNFVQQNHNAIEELSNSSDNQNMPHNVSLAIKWLQGISNSKMEESQGSLGIIHKIFYLLQPLLSFTGFLEEVRKKFIQVNGLRDCVIVQKYMKAGVTRNFLVVSGQDVLPFGSVSHLPDELKRRSDSWPALFSFILPQNTTDPIDRKELLESFGTIFAEQLLENIKKKSQSNLTNKNLI
jgi:uncharacterized protein